MSRGNHTGELVQPGLSITSKFIVHQSRSNCIYLTSTYSFNLGQIVLAVDSSRYVLGIKVMNTGYILIQELRFVGMSLGIVQASQI